MGELDDDGDVLADAAAVLAARQQVDPLLLRMTTQPFDGDAVDGLRQWMDHVYPQAVPAFARLAGDAVPPALAPAGDRRVAGNPSVATVARLRLQQSPVDFDDSLDPA